MIPRLAGVFLAICAFVLIASITTDAAVPQLINYQGRLTDDTGQPLDTTVELTFKIYADTDGSTLLWEETHSAVVISDGLFQVLLGSLKPIEQSVFGGKDCWLGVSLNGDLMKTLLPIVSVAYAYRANVSDTASRANSVADNSITSAKIQNATISFVDIAQNGATADQVIKWNGSAWTAQADATGSNTSGWTDGGTVVSLTTASDTVAINTSLRLGKLNVGGSMSMPGQSSIYFDTDSTYIKGYTGGDMRIQCEDLFAQTQGSIYFRDDDDVNWVEFDGVNRQVGVGTIAPDERLQVENDASGGRSFLQLETSHATNFGETGIRFKTPQNTWHLRMDDYTNNNLADGALGLRSQTGVEAMTWLEDGKVGIGTTNPTRKLHVYGSAQIKDTLYAGAINPSLMSALRLPDEPGLVTGAGTGGIGAGTSIGLGTSIFDSASITTPGAGYVLACETVTFESSHSGGDRTFVNFTLSSSQDWSLDNYQILELDGSIPSGTYRFPASASAVFSVGTADSYTYYVLGYRTAGTDAITALHSRLTLIYIPTAYGDAKGISAASTGEAGVSSKVQLTANDQVASSDNQQLDLTAELRALREKVELLEKKLEEE